MDPLTPSQVMSTMLTPITPMMGQTEEQDEVDCPICYEPFTEAVETSCGHVFCNKCIRKALSLADHCPLCKYRLIDSLSERWQQTQARDHYERVFRLLATSIAAFPVLALFLTFRAITRKHASIISISDSTDSVAFKITTSVVSVLYVITFSEWLEWNHFTLLRTNTGICATLGMATGVFIQPASDYWTMRLAELQMVGMMLLMMLWLYRQQRDLVDKIIAIRS